MSILQYMQVFLPKMKIVADAINTGQPFGSIARIANDDIPAFFQTKLSNHQLGLSDLLALLTLKGEMPEDAEEEGYVTYGSSGHTNEFVSIYAIGGSKDSQDPTSLFSPYEGSNYDKFDDMIDNTDIFKIMSDFYGLK